METFENYKILFDLLVPDISELVLFGIFQKSQEICTLKPLVLMVADSMVESAIQDGAIRKSFIEKFPNELLESLDEFHFFKNQRNLKLELLSAKINAGNQRARNLFVRYFRNESLQNQHLQNHGDLLVEVVAARMEGIRMTDSSMFHIFIEKNFFHFSWNDQMIELKLRDVKLDGNWSTEIPYQLAKVAFRCDVKSIIFQFDGQGEFSKEELEAQLEHFKTSMKTDNLNYFRSDEYEVHPVLYQDNKVWAFFKVREPIERRRWRRRIYW